MKKTNLLVMVVLMLISTLSFSQEKIDINGFGKIQLNMELDSIITSVKEKVTDDRDYFSKVYKNKSSTEFVELIADSSTNYPIFGSFSKNVRVFHIGELYVTDKIALHDVKLYFYNNKLYKIYTTECLSDLLELKYGEPKINTKEKKHTFINGYGAKFIKTDIHADYNWETSNNINLSCIAHFYYNDDGKLRDGSFTFLNLIDISTKVEKEEEIVSERIKKRKENAEKEKVSGF
jgi:hypothetical protein